MALRPELLRREQHSATWAIYPKQRVYLEDEYWPGSEHRWGRPVRGMPRLYGQGCGSGLQGSAGEFVPDGEGHGLGAARGAHLGEDVAYVGLYGGMSDRQFV